MQKPIPAYYPKTLLRICALICHDAFGSGMCANKNSRKSLPILRHMCSFSLFHMRFLELVLASHSC